MNYLLIIVPFLSILIMLFGTPIGIGKYLEKCFIHVELWENEPNNYSYSIGNENFESINDLCEYLYKNR